MGILQDMFDTIRGRRVSATEPSESGPSPQPYAVDETGFDTLQAAFDAVRPGAVIQASGTISTTRRFCARTT